MKVISRNTKDSFMISLIVGMLMVVPFVEYTDCQLFNNSLMSIYEACESDAQQITLSTDELLKESKQLILSANLSK